MLPASIKEPPVLVGCVWISAHHFSKLSPVHFSAAFMQPFGSGNALRMKPVATPDLVGPTKYAAGSCHVEEQFAIPDRPVFWIKPARLLEGRSTKECRGLYQDCTSVHVLPDCPAIG